MSKQPELLALAEAYTACTGKSEATVANYTGNDGQFFTRLRAGSRCWPEKREKLIAWFSDHWPDDAEWPACVDRPAPCETAGPARRPARAQPVAA